MSIKHSFVLLKLISIAGIHKQWWIQESFEGIDTNCSGYVAS